MKNWEPGNTLAIWLLQLIKFVLHFIDLRESYVNLTQKLQAFQAKLISTHFEVPDSCVRNGAWILFID